MRQVAQHLREKGWLDKAYLYLWDEPEPDYFDKVVALQKLALQGDPGFKIWETTSPNYQAFWGVVKAWSVPFGRPHFNEETRGPAPQGRRRDLGLQHPGVAGDPAADPPALVLAGRPLRRHRRAAMECHLLQRD